MTKMKAEDGSSRPTWQSLWRGDLGRGVSWEVVGEGACSQHAERGSEASALFPPAAVPLELGKPSRSLQDPGTTSAHFQIMLKSVEPDEGRVGVSPLQTAAREFHPLPGPRKVAAVSHSDCHPHPSPPSPQLRSSALILSDHVPFQTKWKTAASRKKMFLPYHPQRQDNQGFKVGSFCKPSFLT